MFSNNSSNAEIARKRAKITIKKESEQYDAIIPVAALKKDSVGYYVLVLKKEDSVLGNGYVAHRVSVDLPKFLIGNRITSYHISKILAFKISHRQSRNLEEVDTTVEFLRYNRIGGIHMSGNREYKSDVFSMLLEDPNNTLQLYNALNESNYTDPGMVEIRTLDKGVSLSVRNDSAFVLDSNLSIYEHQSSVCPNRIMQSRIMRILNL